MLRQHLGFVLIGLAALVVGTGGPTSYAAPLPSSGGSSEVVVTDTGAIVVVDSAHKWHAGALVTWGSSGVVWASPDARTIVVDPASGLETEAPILVTASAPLSMAAAATFTCTVYADNPVNYLSSGLVGGQGEQICSGNYITQRVAARIQARPIPSWPSWGTGPWSWSSWAAGSYRTSTAFSYCETSVGGNWQYRTNAQGEVGSGAFSPIVLSSAEPRYTC